MHRDRVLRGVGLEIHPVGSATAAWLADMIRSGLGTVTRHRLARPAVAGDTRSIHGGLMSDHLFLAELRNHDEEPCIVAGFDSHSPLNRHCQVWVYSALSVSSEQRRLGIGALMDYVAGNWGLRRVYCTVPDYTPPIVKDDLLQLGEHEGTLPQTAVLDGRWSDEHIITAVYE